MKSQRGFTLIELMVTIAVLAVVLGIAIPSFSNIVSSNRVDGGAQELYGALQLARSEAVKRRASVSICRSNADFDDCADGTDWSAGWLMVTSAEDEPLRVWEAQGLEIEGPSAGVTFLASGMVSSEEDFTVTVPNCTGDQARSISVRRVGSATLTREAC